MDCSTNYRELPRALDEFKPDMVVYNAGTDILKGDPLGVLDITPEVRVSLSLFLSFSLYCAHTCVTSTLMSCSTVGSEGEGQTSI